ncbi:hypothetical protein KGQ20_02680 [Catenulispora sp. NF23]|nr:hypothetical protein [Catenulispora pinistramenti]MBS2531671.1 hypothetical protein [Catenulispora pinistramenti]
MAVHDVGQVLQAEQVDDRRLDEQRLGVGESAAQDVDAQVAWAALEFGDACRFRRRDLSFILVRRLLRCLGGGGRVG